jgi:hypothetical protein
MGDNRHPPRTIGFLDLDQQLRSMLVSFRPEAEKLMARGKEVLLPGRGMSTPAGQPVGPDPGASSGAAGPLPHRFETSGNSCIIRLQRPAIELTLEVKQDMFRRHFGDQAPDRRSIQPSAFNQPDGALERRPTQGDQVAASAQIRRQGPGSRRRINFDVGHNVDRESFWSKDLRVSDLQSRQQLDAPASSSKSRGESLDNHWINPGKCVVQQCDAAARPLRSAPIVHNGTLGGSCTGHRDRLADSEFNSRSGDEKAQCESREGNGSH